MGMIGLGVTTRNRLPWLAYMLGRLDATIGRPVRDGDIALAVADDGSTDGTAEWLTATEWGFRPVLGDHQGIAANKNRLLDTLHDCDVVMLLDDDVLCFRPDWHLILAAIVQSDLGIGCLQVLVDGCPEIPEVTQHMTHGVDADGLRVGWSTHHTGALLVTTREAIDLVGPFDERFRGYGFEHCEWQNRFTQKGLNQPSGNPTFAHPGWFHMSHAPSCVAPHWDDPEFQAQLEANRKLYFWGA